jgi:branched-chain amino acid transport system permease protein
VLQYLLTGLSFGSLYALLGLGLLLTLRSTNVLNFAEGGTAMLMAFVCFEFATAAGLPVILAIGAALLTAGLFGCALYNFVIYPLRARDRDSLAIVALALELAITGLAALYWGVQSRVFPKLFSASGVEFAGFVLSTAHFATIVFGFLSMIAIAGLLYWTDLGLAMRVAAENGEVAQLLGVNLRVVGSTAWIAAACLGTVTGVLYASTTFLEPYMMGLLVLKGFAALVVGGMSSVLGVVVGGILLGLSESLVAYALTPLLQDSVGLALIILVLLLRPQGLIGSGAGWRA